MTIVTDTGSMENHHSVVLPALLLLVASWAESESRNILMEGKPLAFWQIAEAELAGVRDPAQVRILSVDTIPEPRNSRLLDSTLSTGLLGPETLALTLGYGIFIVSRKIGQRHILRHELRHVAQYEKAGSITAFLAEYLDQIARFGYPDAPLEMDACDHARWKPRFR